MVKKLLQTKIYYGILLLIVLPPAVYATTSAHKPAQQVHQAAINGDMGFFNSLSGQKHIAKTLNSKDKRHDNFTTLHYAVAYNQEGVVRFILAQPGMQVNAKTKTQKSTALHLLAHHRHFDLLDLFIDYRKRQKQNKKQFACLYMNPKDKDKKTPFYYFQQAYSPELDQYKTKWNQLLGKKSKPTKVSLTKPTSHHNTQPQVQPIPRRRRQSAVSATSQPKPQKSANTPGDKTSNPTKPSQKQAINTIFRKLQNTPQGLASLKSMLDRAVYKKPQPQKNSHAQQQLNIVPKELENDATSDVEAASNPVSVANDHKSSSTQMRNTSIIAITKQLPVQNSHKPDVQPVTEGTAGSAIHNSPKPLNEEPNQTKQEPKTEGILQSPCSDNESQELATSDDPSSANPVSVANDHKLSFKQVLNTSSIATTQPFSTQISNRPEQLSIQKNIAIATFPKPLNEHLNEHEKETKKESTPQLLLPDNISQASITSDNEDISFSISIAKDHISLSDQLTDTNTIATKQLFPEKNSHNPAVSTINTSPHSFDIEAHEHEKENAPEPPLPDNFSNGHPTPHTSHYEASPNPISVELRQQLFSSDTTPTYAIAPRKNSNSKISMNINTTFEELHTAKQTLVSYKSRLDNPVYKKSKSTKKPLNGTNKEQKKEKAPTALLPNNLVMEPLTPTASNDESLSKPLSAAHDYTSLADQGTDNSTIASTKHFIAQNSHSPAVKSTPKHIAISGINTSLAPLNENEKESTPHSLFSDNESQEFFTSDDESSSTSFSVENDYKPSSDQVINSSNITTTQQFTEQNSHSLEVTAPPIDTIESAINASPNLLNEEPNQTDQEPNKESMPHSLFSDNENQESITNNDESASKPVSAAHDYTSLADQGTDNSTIASTKHFIAQNSHSPAVKSTPKHIAISAINTSLVPLNENEKESTPHSLFSDNENQASITSDDKSTLNPVAAANDHKPSSKQVINTNTIAISKQFPAQMSDKPDVHSVTEGTAGLAINTSPNLLNEEPNQTEQKPNKENTPQPSFSDNESQEPITTNDESTSKPVSATNDHKPSSDQVLNSSNITTTQQFTAQNSDSPDIPSTPTNTAIPAINTSPNPLNEASNENEQETNTESQEIIASDDESAVNPISVANDHKPSFDQVIYTCTIDVTTPLPAQMSHKPYMPSTPTDTAGSAIKTSPKPINKASNKNEKETKKESTPQSPFSDNESQELITSNDESTSKPVSAAHDYTSLSDQATDTSTIASTKQFSAQNSDSPDVKSTPKNIAISAINTYLKPLNEHLNENKKQNTPQSPFSHNITKAPLLALINGQESSASSVDFAHDHQLLSDHEIDSSIIHPTQHSPKESSSSHKSSEISEVLASLNTTKPALTPYKPILDNPVYKKPKSTKITLPKQPFNVTQKEPNKGGTPQAPLPDNLNQEPLTPPTSDDEGTAIPVSVAHDQIPFANQAMRARGIAATQQPHVQNSQKVQSIKKKHTIQQKHITPSTTAEKEHKCSVNGRRKLIKTTKHTTQMIITTTEETNLFHYLQYLVGVLLLGSILYLVLFN